MSALAPAPVRYATSPCVPFVDLKAQFAQVRDEVFEAFTAIAESGCYVLGPPVAAFEESFALAHGVKHCIALNTGTSALHLALLGAGVGLGDEVLTVPMTFVATSWAISYCGARPVFVDVDPVTYTMDPNRVADSLTPRTKAILPVHLYGQPTDLGSLQEIADCYGIALVEDAAQAHLAAYRGKPVGGFGLASAFSFYPGKNLGAYGDGGIVVTNDPQVAESVSLLRNYGQKEKYHHTSRGFNRRLDSLQAAILRAKLKHLEAWNAARSAHAGAYQDLLIGTDVRIPRAAETVEPVWHLFVVQAARRNDLRDYLARLGIATGIHYPIPIHLQPAYRDLGYQRGDFPITEQAADQILSLPMYPELPADAIAHVASAIGAFLTTEHAASIPA